MRRPWACRIVVVLAEDGGDPEPGWLLDEAPDRQKKGGASLDAPQG